jgi:hypothetical protein
MAGNLEITEKGMAIADIDSAASLLTILDMLQTYSSCSSPNDKLDNCCQHRDYILVYRKQSCPDHTLLCRFRNPFSLLNYSIRGIRGELRNMEFLLRDQPQTD